MWKAYALVMLAIILFSGNFIAGKVATAAIAPFTLAWLRTLIAFLLLLTFARQEFKYARPVMMKNWKALYGMALTGVVLFPALVYAFRCDGARLFILKGTFYSLSINRGAYFFSRCPLHHHTRIMGSIDRLRI